MKSEPVAFEPVTVQNDRYRVSLEWLQEGEDGDYRKDDPTDVPLLRYDVAEQNGTDWEDLPDSSYCTDIDARIPRERQLEAAQTILDILTTEGASKRLMERVSWIH